MNSSDRIRSVIRFQQTDRPPLAPEMVAVTATLQGTPIKDYVSSGDVIAECQLAARDMIDADAVFAISDLCVEAEAVGSELHFPDDNYPHVVKPAIMDPADIGKAGVPDPTSDGRMPEILKAARILRAQTSNHIPVFANAIGPITLASRIMDIEKMLYMIVDYPDQFQTLLDYCLKVTTTFAEALISEGVDGILVFDPTASPSVLPAKIFRQFEVNAIRSMFASIKNANPEAITWYSVAGPVQTNPAIITEVGADITTVDYLAPLDAVMAYSNYSTINGNIKPSLFLDGNEDDIYNEARRLLAATRHTERFILGSGCEIPLNSRPENILALKRALDDESGSFETANSQDENTHELTIMPYRKRVYVEPGANLLDAAQTAGAPIIRYCDYSGSCGKCRVTIDSGELSPPEEIETVQLKSNGNDDSSRLACLAKMSGPASIYVPYSSRRLKHRADIPGILYQKSLEKQIEAFGLSPNIIAKRFDVSNLPSEPPVSYDGWLAEQFGERQVNSHAVGNFVSCVHENCSGLFAVIDTKRNEVIDFSRTPKIYGIAIDISATAISAYVHNLTSGELVCVNSVENPLLSHKPEFFAETLDRIGDPATRVKLQRKLIEGINDLIFLCHDNHSIPFDQIYDLTVVANPVITHLFLGLDLGPGSGTPFTLAISRAVSTWAGALRSNTDLTVNPICRVEILPSVSGYVGADAVASALVMESMGGSGASLLVKMGSTGEVFLSSGGRILCASIRSGSIFEFPKLNQANVFHNGLIYKFRIGGDGSVDYETLGGVTPFGLTGSSLIDVMADFGKYGIEENDGKFSGRDGWRHLTQEAFVLAPKHKTATFNPICVTANDVREARLAADEYSRAVSALIEEMNIKPGMVRDVFITGPLGALIDTENARSIGVVPDLPNASFSFVENAAGVGARIALLSTNARKRAEEIAGDSERIELNNYGGRGARLRKGQAIS